MATKWTDGSSNSATSTQDKVLETGASMMQSFQPINNHCAHLNAFHTPFAAPGSRAVEANHYCSHITLPASSTSLPSQPGQVEGESSIRQCVLYDSAGPNARLIGVEYMIHPSLYATLPPAEKPLWHSHVFEVQSGMLVMPTAATSIPGIKQAWEMAETTEMKEVVELYGKVFHTWQTDLGHALPLGKPELMTSFTALGQFEDFEKVVGDRDVRHGSDWKRAKELRNGIHHEVHPEADGAWK